MTLLSCVSLVNLQTATTASWTSLWRRWGATRPPGAVPCSCTSGCCRWAFGLGRWDAEMHSACCCRRCLHVRCGGAALHLLSWPHHASLPPSADWVPPRRPPVHHAHPRVLAARPGQQRAGDLRLDAGEQRTLVLHWRALLLMASNLAALGSCRPEQSMPPAASRQTFG